MCAKLRLKKIMKKIFILLLLINAQIVKSQISEIVSDNFNFKYKKVVENSRNFELFTSNHNVTVKDKKYKKIQIRFRVNSISKKRTFFDPNKFSLVVKNDKIRVRPIDIKYNYLAHNYEGFTMINSQLKKKKKYKNLKDSFYDYSIDGFKNISPKINFGTMRNSRNEEIFYAGKKLRRNVVDVYFSVPKEFNKGEVYFGNKSVASFLIEK